LQNLGKMQRGSALKEALEELQPPPQNVRLDCIVTDRILTMFSSATFFSLNSRFCRLQMDILIPVSTSDPQLVFQVREPARCRRSVM